MPSASSLESTKESIGFRTQPAARPRGVGGLAGGAKAQCVVFGFAEETAEESAGQCAPWSIQAQAHPTCSAVRRGPPIGIAFCFEVPSIRAISLLAAALPGLITAPE